MNAIKTIAHSLMQWLNGDRMTEIIVDLGSDAVERLERMAAEQGVTVDQLAEVLLNKGLQRLEGQEGAPLAAKQVRWFGIGGPVTLDWAVVQRIRTELQVAAESAEEDGFDGNKRECLALLELLPAAPVLT
jgi:hypothetical protein